MDVSTLRRSDDAHRFTPASPGARDTAPRAGHGRGETPNVWSRARRRTCNTCRDTSEPCTRVYLGAAGGREDVVACKEDRASSQRRGTLEPPPSIVARAVRHVRVERARRGLVFEQRVRHQERARARAAVAAARVPEEAREEEEQPPVLLVCREDVRRIRTERRTCVASGRRPPFTAIG